MVLDYLLSNSSFRLKQFNFIWKQKKGQNALLVFGFS